MGSGTNDLLWSAVREAIGPVVAFETEMDTSRLEKRIRDAFKRGAKGLVYSAKPWTVLVNDYADSVFSSIFSGLGESRPWLCRVDFVLALDAGIKEFFPPCVLCELHQQEFERTVLAAHDRAFEEQRYFPLLWNTVCPPIVQETSRKKVCKAAEFGRTTAMQAMRNGPVQMKEFVSRWIDLTIMQLSKVSQGFCEDVLREPSAVELFNNMIVQGALPLSLTSEYGLPPDHWPFVEFSVHQAYVAHSCAEGRACPRNGERKARAARGARRERRKRSVSCPPSHIPIFRRTTDFHETFASAVITDPGAYGFADVGSTGF